MSKTTCALTNHAWDDAHKVTTKKKTEIQSDNENKDKKEDHDGKSPAQMGMNKDDIACFCCGKTGLQEIQKGSKNRSDSAGNSRKGSGNGLPTNKLTQRTARTAKQAQGAKVETGEDATGHGLEDRTRQL